MSEANSHAMYAAPDHDERARQDFVASLREHLAREVAPGNWEIYETKIKPQLLRDGAGEPKDRADAARIMTKNDYYQTYSCIQRCSQEMMWDSVIDTVERTLPEMIGQADAFAEGASGSLRLNPDVEVPSYITQYDIHLQPGGYLPVYCQGDVAAGALYDRAAQLYAIGVWGPNVDYLGRSLINLYKELRPNVDPQRILDMGCTTGNCTTAWAENFPNAEVHGIDVGEALLRYGHARAASMGHTVHFSQQNAEHTDFDDDTFDLVVSHLFMHETSKDAVVRIFQESRRILKQGGLMMHLDIPRLDELPPVRAFFAAWETYNVNEYFAGVYRDMDVVAAAIEAGFSEDKARIEKTPLYKQPKFSNYNTNISKYPVIVAEK